MSSSRTDKFIKNSITTALYQIILMIANFATPKAVLMFYGSEMNGLVSSINQFMSCFSIVEAGLSGASVFALYKPLADNDREGISSIVSATKKFYYYSGYIFTLLVLIMAVIYPIFVHTELMNSHLLSLLIIILGAKGFLDFFTLAKYRAILMADQRVFMVSIGSSVYIILNTMIICFLAYFRVNIIIVYGMAIIALLARSFLLRFYCRKNYPYINYNAKPNTKALDKRWDALFLQFVGAAQHGVPSIIATFVTTLQSVSVLSVYMLIMNGINSVLGIFISGLQSSFGDVIAKNESKTLKNAYSQFEFIYLQLIAVVYGVSFIVIMPFVGLYTKNVNDADYMVYAVGFLSVLNGLLYNMHTPQGMLVQSAGHYRETRWRSATQALILVICSYIFALFMGIRGILIGMCLSNLYRTIDLFFYVPKYIINTEVRESFKNYLLMFLTIVIVFSLQFIIKDTAITSWISWIIYSAIILILASATSLVICLIFNRREFINVLRRIIKK